MNNTPRQRFSDPDMEDLEPMRRPRRTLPFSVIPIVTAEPVFFGEMRTLDEKYGRNFRNLMRQRIEARILLLDQPPKFETYLEDFPIDDLLEWLQVRLTHSSWPWGYNELFYLRKQTGMILAQKEEHIAKLEQSDEREDWEEWHKSILRQCLVLNERFPNHFWILLEAFMKPIHWGIVMSKEDEGQHKMGLEEVERILEEQSVGEAVFKKWLEIIDGYKYNQFCGFMFKVLEPWLNIAQAALSNSLSDFYPHLLEQKSTELGAPQGHLPKMEVLHEPQFRELRQLLQIRTERPHDDEPLLPKSHPDYDSAREILKRQNALNFGCPLFRKPATVTEPSSPTKSSFKIARPFPNKGGFKVKGVKLDIIRNTTSRKS